MRNNILIRIYHSVFMTVIIHFAASQECPPGTFLYTIIQTGQHFCIECQDGTFMSLSNHQQTACRPCEKLREPNLERLVSPCKKTHDTVIHCVYGYYRDEARNPRETGQCKKCTQCEFVGHPCSTYKDTVCCWDENFDVVPNHHGVPVCRERPWFCRQGQYFDTRGFQCLPCPDNTFMPIDYHIQPECWKCREYDKYESYRPLHSVIIQPCNSTHAPVIRCEVGFYMNPKMSYTDDALGCSPCTDCSTTDVQYEGRKCDGMEDTVCCPQPNMTVVDTSEGPVCSSKAFPAECSNGYCEQHDVRKRSTVCVPCQPRNDVKPSDIAVINEITVPKTTQENSPLRDVQIEARTVHCEKNLIIGLALAAATGLVSWIILLFIYMKCVRKCDLFEKLQATSFGLSRGMYIVNQDDEDGLDNVKWSDFGDIRDNLQVCSQN